MAGLKAGGYILTEAGLSFLGLGAQPPTATWGSMISASRVFINSARLVRASAMAFGRDFMSGPFPHPAEKQAFRPPIKHPARDHRAATGHGKKQGTDCNSTAYFTAQILCRSRHAGLGEDNECTEHGGNCHHRKYRRSNTAAAQVS